MEFHSLLLDEIFRRDGAPGEIRTPDLMLRRHSLYPAELRARSFKDNAKSGGRGKTGLNDIRDISIEGKIAGA
jgi:hypothetical protein